MAHWIGYPVLRSLSFKSGTMSVHTSFWNWPFFCFGGCYLSIPSIVVLRFSIGTVKMRREDRLFLKRIPQDIIFWGNSLFEFSATIFSVEVGLMVSRYIHYHPSYDLGRNAAQLTYIDVADVFNFVITLLTTKIRELRTEEHQEWSVH